MTPAVWCGRAARTPPGQLVPLLLLLLLLLLLSLFLLFLFRLAISLLVSTFWFDVFLLCVFYNILLIPLLSLFLLPPLCVHRPRSGARRPASSSSASSCSSSSCLLSSSFSPSWRLLLTAAGECKGGHPPAGRHNGRAARAGVEGRQQGYCADQFLRRRRPLLHGGGGPLSFSFC